MSSYRREESYLVAKNKISPVVEMTRACHSDQREGSFKSLPGLMFKMCRRNSDYYHFLSCCQPVHQLW